MFKYINKNYIMVIIGCFLLLIFLFVVNPSKEERKDEIEYLININIKNETKTPVSKMELGIVLEEETIINIENDITEDEVNFLVSYSPDTIFFLAGEMDNGKKIQKHYFDLIDKSNVNSEQKVFFIIQESKNGFVIAEVH